MTQEFKEKMRDANVSVQDICAVLSISSSIAYDLIKGKWELSPTDAEKLASLLHVDVSWIKQYIVRQRFIEYYRR